MAGTYDFRIEKKASFRPTMIYKNSSGDAVNLTGFTAEMRIGSDPDSEVLENYFVMTTENGGIILGGSSGTITLYIQKEFTNVAWDWAQYRLDLIDADGVANRFLKGKIFAEDDVP